MLEKKMYVGEAATHSLPIISPYAFKTLPTTLVADLSLLIFFIPPPIALVGIPVRVSAYMKSTVKILVDPNKMKLDAIAKIVPAKNVSTVS